MTLYLLDTNVCIQYLRNRDPVLIGRIEARRPDEIRLCSVVLAELYYGAYKSPAVYQAANLALLAKFLPRFQSLPFDDATAEYFGRIRADVAARGVMLGPYDLQDRGHRPGPRSDPRDSQHPRVRPGARPDPGRLAGRAVTHPRGYPSWTRGPHPSSGPPRAGDLITGKETDFSPVSTTNRPRLIEG